MLFYELAVPHQIVALTAGLPYDEPYAIVGNISFKIRS